MKKIGLLAYSSNTGLGHQTYEFYKHMNPHKTLVVDLSKFNAMQTHHEKYQGDRRIVYGIPTNSDMEWLLQDVDIVFECETPLNYYLHKRAKELGVKIVQQYNYEFLDYFNHPEFTAPHTLAAPSTWNTDLVEALKVAPVKQLYVPTNREFVPFRRIEKCNRFVHIIGRPAFKDRNGTLPFLDAVERIGDKFKYTVSYQAPRDARASEYFAPVLARLEEVSKKVPIEILVDIPNYNELFTLGDVLVLPRRYGGLCLPMQEGLSSGMPVIMTNISPNNDRLPREWLVRAFLKEKFRFHADVDVYEVDVDDLVNTMLQFENDGFMSTANLNADAIAEIYSWRNQVEKYNKFFEELE